ncbi:hypothetical protein P43SY_010095 [Pythium insidiosum]|uniref:Uncharacterized protein n=1 Tax=Pythium insidiosum TaxID=114742 RepID=A0AAD5LM22_PYTIN|nr:hypothetical protein P43SY_010095 [Pythium insidiosum]
MEATRSSSLSLQLEKQESVKISEKQQAQEPAPLKNEYMINMISSVKPTSPKPGKAASVTVVPFLDMTAMDCGGDRAGPARSSGLFRSSSFNSDGTEKATVVVTLNTKKTIEFEMRSVKERAEFVERMAPLVPALLPSLRQLE